MIFATITNIRKGGKMHSSWKYDYSEPLQMRFADFVAHVGSLRKTALAQENRFAGFINGTNVLPKVQKAIVLVVA